MPIDVTTLSRVAMPVSQAEGLKILERDHYCCRYCGLDGKACFENALVMSVDFIVPRAHKGKKNPANLVACCRPCNMIKGKRVYRTFEEAQKYVLQRREELRHSWESKFTRHAIPAEEYPVRQELCAGI
jgi:5-methylcytosine-specific restriction endonuclease McrA